jgi:hypothetical protein
MQTVGRNFMKASDLAKYLDNQTPGNLFFNSIRTEVLNYNELMKKTGSSIALTFDEDQKTTLGIGHFKKLLQDIQLTQSNPSYLSYICDCLTLGENVEYDDDKIEDLIWTLSDPEINRKSTAAEIQKLLDAL